MSYLWSCKTCHKTWWENRDYVMHRKDTGHDREDLSETDTGPYEPSSHTGKAHVEVQAAAMLVIGWANSRQVARSKGRREPEPPAGLAEAEALLAEVDERDERRMEMALKAVRDAGLVDTPPPGLPELFEMISPREPSED